MGSSLLISGWVMWMPKIRCLFSLFHDSLLSQNCSPHCLLSFVFFQERAWGSTTTDSSGHFCWSNGNVPGRF
jgi:hypothetical protein